MPIIKGAKKALRQTKKRTEINKKKKVALKLAVENFKKSKTEKNLNLALQLVDKLTKTSILHKNKAARIKSRLAKMLPLKPSKKRSRRKKTT